MATRKIELSADQYRQLMKLVYLGYWMANARKEEPDGEFDDLEQHMYNLAKIFGMDDISEYDDSLGKYMPAPDFEEELETTVQEYDDYVFWEELAWRMAERDFTRKFDHAQILCMTGDEILREKNTLADRYFEEFSINGVENLHFTI